jgi:hypothetical protein
MEECCFVGDYAVPISVKGKKAFGSSYFISTRLFKEKSYPFELGRLVERKDPFNYLKLKKDEDYKILQVLPVERGA